MLKGERAETYVTDGGESHMVCDLCFQRAEGAGWVRESERGHVPARASRPPERRALFGRRRRREEVAQATDGSVGQREPVGGETTDDGDAAMASLHSPRRRPEPPQDPRHVRAVPTTYEARVERALELFNGSHHSRTVAGLARSLGGPFVAAQPDAGATSTVTLLVGWELSWYRYTVDLGDAAQPVELHSKGDELGDVDESLREWNAELDADGCLVIGVKPR